MSDPKFETVIAEADCLSDLETSDLFSFPFGPISPLPRDLE